MSSSCEDTEEKRPAKRSKRQRGGLPTDMSTSFIASTSCDDTEEERPARGSEQRISENDIADASVSSSTNHNRGKHERQIPRSLTVDSPSHILSSSPILKKTPARRSKSQKSRDHTAPRSPKSSRRSKQISLWQLDDNGTPAKIKL